MPPHPPASPDLDLSESGGATRAPSVSPVPSARVSSALRRRRAALRRVARAAGASRGELVESATRATCEALGAAAARCVRFDGDVAVVVCEEPAETVLPPGDDLPLARLRRSGSPVWVRRDDDVSVAFPVLVGDRLWGALVGDLDDEDAMSRQEADASGIAIAEVFAAALAARPPGGHDRRTFVSEGGDMAGAEEFRMRLGQEVERARRYVRDLSLVLLELHHLKSVNGLRGPDAGDRVLAEFSRRLTRTARAGELVGRLGGSEFGWILPESGVEQAQRAAERLVRELDAGRGDELGAVAAGAADLGGASDAVDLYEQARLALTCSRLAGDESCTPYSVELAAAVAGEGVTGTIERSRTLVGLRAMARAVDAKDPFTQRHSERVAALAGCLASRLGWSAPEVQLLHQAALVHDVGKIGVPDAVLFKPGRLDDVEYELVKAHAELGAEIVSGTLSARQVGWVRGHHERWDGCGYPDGLLGAEIPDGARILALADAWDAMTTERSYRAPSRGSEAILECHNQAGLQFWPPAVEALMALWGEGRLFGLEDVDPGA